MTRPMSILTSDFFDSKNPIQFFNSLPEQERNAFGKSLHKVRIYKDSEDQEPVITSLIVSAIVEKMEKNLIVIPTYLVKHPQAASFKKSEVTKPKVEEVSVPEVETPAEPEKQDEVSEEVVVDEPSAPEEVEEVPIVEQPKKKTGRGRRKLV